MSAATLLASWTWPAFMPFARVKPPRSGATPAWTPAVSRAHPQHKPALLVELTPRDAEIIGSEASRRSLTEIAHRVARI